MFTEAKLNIFQTRLTLTERHSCFNFGVTTKVELFNVSAGIKSTEYP